MKSEELLTRWHKTIRRYQVEHELSSRFYEKLNWKFGIPVVISSTIVGASIFATIEQPTNVPLLKIFFGALSLISAVLASLQTFLGFDDRAGGHKAAAFRFGELAKEIQQVRM